MEAWPEKRNCFPLQFQEHSSLSLSNPNISRWYPSARIAVKTGLSLSSRRFLCEIALERAQKIEFSGRLFTAKSHFRTSPLRCPHLGPLKKENQQAEKLTLNVKDAFRQGACQKVVCDLKLVQRAHLPESCTWKPAGKTIPSKHHLLQRHRKQQEHLIHEASEQHYR